MILEEIFQRFDKIYSFIQETRRIFSKLFRLTNDLINRRALAKSTEVDENFPVVIGRSFHEMFLPIS